MFRFLFILCLNIIVLFRFRKPFCDKTFLLIEVPRGHVKFLHGNNLRLPMGPKTSPRNTFSGAGPSKPPQTTLFPRVWGLPSFFQQPLPRVLGLPGLFEQFFPRVWGLPSIFKQLLSEGCEASFTGGGLMGNSSNCLQNGRSRTRFRERKSTKTKHGLANCVLGGGR